jgi:hypothetical protein
MLATQGLYEVVNVGEAAIATADELEDRILCTW